MTLFGEIIEPSSRALCDFDEDQQDNTVIDVIWEGSNEPPNIIPTLIFAEGNCAVLLFRKSVLNKAQLKCSCSAIGVQIYQLNSNEELTPKSYVCLLEKSNNFTQAEVIDILKSWIVKAKNVYCFSTLKMIEYQTRLSQEKPAIILRRLQIPSNDEDDKFNIPILEQPNIITGKVAAVLSYRMHIDQSATLFICYLDQELDSTTAKPILNLLNKLNIQTTPFTGVISTVESNLYL